MFRSALAAIAMAIVPISVAADDANAPIILATNYPPFDIKIPVDGLHGFDHEVATEAFKRQGIDARIIYVPWSRAVSETENGHSPGLLTCARTEDRARHYMFSAPISQEAYGIFYRSGFPVDEINEMTDLAGFSIASVLEYAPNATLKEKGVILTDTPSDEIGFKMLKLDRVDFVYTGLAAGKFLIRQMGLEGMFEFKSFVVWDYHLCFSRKHPSSEQLRMQFNSGLAELKADQTYEKIHAKYR